MSVIRGPFGELRAETEMIDVTSSLPRPDPRWTYTDHAGHPHRYDKQAPGHYYPTLVEVTDEGRWCPDCHEEHTDSHYECPLCGEEIEPGLESAPLYREYVPGLVSYYLNDEPISKDDYERLVAEMRP